MCTWVGPEGLGDEKPRISRISRIGKMAGMDDGALAGGKRKEYTC